MNVVADTIAGVGVFLSGYFGKRKLDRTRRGDAKAETKAEVDDVMAKAKELADLRSDLKVLSTDIGWIKEQLGRNPNGGNAMQQVLSFVNTANQEFSDIKAWNMRHMEFHLDDKKG